MTTHIVATSPVVEFQVLPQHVWTFNEFTRANRIYADRDLFHEFIESRLPTTLAPESEWIDLWGQFERWGREATIAAQDARDLQQTQQDTLV